MISALAPSIRRLFEKLLPGGKGINVSIVLANLGHESTALGFAARIYREKEIEARLKQFGCGIDFSSKFKTGFHESTSR